MLSGGCYTESPAFYVLVGNRGNLLAAQLCGKALLMEHPVISDAIHSLMDKLTCLLSADPSSHPLSGHKPVEPPPIEHPIRVCAPVSIQTFSTIRTFLGHSHKILLNIHCLCVCQELIEE